MTPISVGNYVGIFVRLGCILLLAGRIRNKYPVLSLLELYCVGDKTVVIACSAFLVEVMKTTK